MLLSFLNIYNFIRLKGSTQDTKTYKSHKTKHTTINVAPVIRQRVDGWQRGLLS